MNPTPAETAPDPMSSTAALDAALDGPLDPSIAASSRRGYVGMRPEESPLTPSGHPRNTAETYHSGRPSSYKPEYCDVLIQCAREGLSLTSFAGTIEVSVETVSRWSAIHPEFREAVKRAQAIRTAALEHDLLKADKMPKVTSRIFALKNAAPHEFRDKVEVESTAKEANNPLASAFVQLVQHAAGSMQNATFFAGVKFDEVAAASVSGNAADMKTIDANAATSDAEKPVK